MQHDDDGVAYHHAKHRVLIAAAVHIQISKLRGGGVAGGVPGGVPDSLRVTDTHRRIVIVIVMLRRGCET